MIARTAIGVSDVEADTSIEKPARLSVASRRFLNIESSNEPRIRCALPKR